MTPQLQLTAADAGRRYGETDTVMSLVFVGPGPVHESLSLEFFNFDINMQ